MANEIRLFDNSRLDGVRTCAMYFLLRYKRHWETTGKRPPLIFGSCWHAGAEAVFRLIKAGTFDHMTLLDAAMTAFNTEWEKEGMPAELSLEQAQKFKARIPGTARDMFNTYLEENEIWLKSIEVLAVEKPFIVKLMTIPGDEVFDSEIIEPSFTDCTITDTDIYISGRLDVVIKDRDGIWPLEHKTTTLYSIKNGFQQKFLNMWSPSSQIDTYIYAAMSIYGNENVPGLYVNGALVHNTVRAFTLIPIMKGIKELKSWFNDCRYWISQILDHEKQDYWPHNLKGCWGPYGACTFRDICEMTYNPATLPGIPPEFKIEPWEPFDEEELKKLIREGEEDEDKT